MYSDYLLTGNAAHELYHQHAQHLPIIDYHNHLSAQEICENGQFGSITELWLAHDHYKWRAMRAAGIDEERITGDASDYAKFEAWISTMERLAGSPLYAWCRMELEQLFGIDLAPSRENAQALYAACNALLAGAEYAPRGILARFKVKVACTTNNPYDILEHHAKLANAGDFRLLPTFRPDELLAIDSRGWQENIRKLVESEDVPIDSLDELKTALGHSLDRFLSMGCRSSDHGFAVFGYRPDSESTVSRTVKKALAGSSISSGEALGFTSHMMGWLCEKYHRHGLVMQLHIGALRNLNQPLFDKLGPDAGGDSASNAVDVAKLAAFLNDLETKGTLPKTVLFSLNRSDWPQLAALSATFAKAPVRCKVQPGAAWWMNDTRQGISSLLTEIANHNLLHGFVGMLTDSRSLASFVRHDYFRRILCSWLGTRVESGEYPDYTASGVLVQDICLNNTITYFNL